MRAKLVILVGLILLTAVVTGVIGATSASGQRVIHVVFGYGKHTKFGFVDVGKTGLRLGDRLAFHGPLSDASGSNRLGAAFADCVVQHHIEGATTGLYECNWLLALENGKIIVQGMDPHGPGKTVFGVLGGTGAYQTARGQATFTDSKTTTDIVVELIG
jgi:hypothetical protein